MLFNSIEFAFFLPLVLLLYWFVFNKSVKAQNNLLLLAGYIFYGWWDWRFLGLLLFSSTVDYVTAYAIEKTESSQKRKWLLAVTLVSNLSILGFFKYYNFFAGSLVSLLSAFHIKPGFTTLHIILPIGISFYTFQSIAYVIDVYRGQMKACKNYFTFMSFVSFFPQLVAGPISRAHNLLVQFYQSRRFQYDVAVTGMRLILYGLFKKVVIADNLAKLVDEVFNNPGSYHGIAVAVASVFFALQIYCDFSGYSDIAIGVARLFGFTLVDNFRTPYFATSLRQFWQRWHISLSTWFRDYLYIPLGGNRVNEGRKYFNLFITFLVSGLWHGANWTFVIWGAIHGGILVIEEFIKIRVKVSPPAFIKWLITITIVVIAWIFFRAKNIDEAFILLRSMAGGWGWATLYALFHTVYYSTVFVNIMLGIVAAFILFEWAFYKQWPSLLNAQRVTVARIAAYYLVILLIAFIGLNDSAPDFIYFKF